MKKLVVLWKTDHMIDINEMVLPYLKGSKKNGWWEDIEVIIWGASQKVIAQSEDLQNQIRQMINLGIKISACKKCADDLCVADQLVNIGIDVLYTGVLLTNHLQSDATVITL